MTTEMKSLNEAVLDRLADEIVQAVIDEAQSEIVRSRAWKVLDQLDSVMAHDVAQVLFYRISEVGPELYDEIRAEMDGDSAVRVFGRLDDLIAKYRPESNGGSK